MSKGVLTSEDLKIPPSEAEISDAITYLPNEQATSVRRLAYQRDILKAKARHIDRLLVLATKHCPRPYTHDWAEILRIAKAIGARLVV